MLLAEELENGRFSGANRPEPLSNSFILTLTMFRTLFSYLEIPSPNLFIACCHDKRRVKSTGVLYVNTLSKLSLSADQNDLVQESRSLVLGPTDEEVLAQFILKIAFSDRSDARNPVLQGVFALASLQLQGNSKSFHYKRLVVSSVKDSIHWLDEEHLIDEKTLLQNLIAMMLLYHYEVVRDNRFCLPWSANEPLQLSLEADSKDTWVVFFCAVKRIINTSPGFQKLVRQEYSVFLDWIYYHEALAEFTVRHWAVPYEGCGFAPIARSLGVFQGKGSIVSRNVLQFSSKSSNAAIGRGPYRLSR
jgi:hypothetical protein